MARCLYCAQFVRTLFATAAKRERRDCSRTEDEKNGAHFGTEAEEMPVLKRAADVDEFLPMK